MDLGREHPGAADDGGVGRGAEAELPRDLEIRVEPRRGTSPRGP